MAGEHAQQVYHCTDKFTRRLGEVVVAAKGLADLDFKLCAVEAFFHAAGEEGLEDFFRVLSGNGAEEVSEHVAHSPCEASGEAPVYHAEAPVRSDEEVPCMRVSVKKTVEENLLKDRFRPSCRQVRGDGRRDTGCARGKALYPVCDEEACSAVGLVNGGRHDIGEGVCGIEMRGVARLDVKVQLLEKAGSGLGDDGWEG